MQLKSQQLLHASFYLFLHAVEQLDLGASGGVFQKGNYSGHVVSIDLSMYIMDLPPN